MQLNLRELVSQGKTVRIVDKFDIRHLLTNRKDIAAVDPLHVELTAAFANGIVDVSGELLLYSEFVCSRCLSQYCQKLHIPVHEMFTQDEGKYDEDELIHQMSGEELVLDPYLEENVLLNIPFVPVCDETCRGLNSQNGANLNFYPTEKQEAPVDPRLAALADFFKDDD